MKNEKDRIIKVNWKNLGKNNKEKPHKLKIVIKKIQLLDEIKSFFGSRHYFYNARRIRRRRNNFPYQILIFYISDIEFIKLVNDFKNQFSQKIVIK